jgi:hypothetical protein
MRYRDFMPPPVLERIAALAVFVVSAVVLYFVFVWRPPW